MPFFGRSTIKGDRLLLNGQSSYINIESSGFGSKVSVLKTESFPEQVPEQMYYLRSYYSEYFTRYQ